MTAADILTTALWVVGVPLAVNSADDLFCDILFWTLAFRRWRRMGGWQGRGRWRPLTLADLTNHPEQPAAILVPAWREGGVIGRMLDHLTTSLDYKDYRVFVGCYPNDPETIRDVDEAAARDKRILRVMLRRPGPTSKADCLNAAWAAAGAFERVHGLEFAFTVVNDAEDVLDPLSLRLFNFVLPRKDMAQLPVIALARPWHRMTGAHYMDEFAEQHGRELVVREFLARQVPSAGVGFALSRRAMAILSRAGAPFNTASLTEDYDLALRLNAEGGSEIFVRFHGPNGLVATREYFPDQFSAAVRQKARWIVGIVFQAWTRHGWPLRFRMIYPLWRDRKAVLVIPLGMAAMMLTIALLVLALVAPRELPVVVPGSGLAWLLAVNGVFLLNRLAHRAFFVARLFGGKQALASIPRLAWATVINFTAVGRATGLWLRHLATRQPIGWDKTAHDFPDLSNRRRRFGEIALAQGWLRTEQLTAALAEQAVLPLRLGEILQRRGWLNAEQVQSILRDQMA